MLQQLTEPAAIIADVWSRLLAGKSDRNHPFHTPAIAITGLDGEPTLRTVVLRRVEPEARVLAFHSDARATKMPMLRARPVVQWLFYDPASRLQIRMISDITIHIGDALAGEHWDAIRSTGHVCYQDPVAPGSVIGQAYVNPAAPPADKGRANFAVVRAVVREIDWLLLLASGHRRARMRLGEPGAFDWIAP